MAATAPLPQLPAAEQHAYDFWFAIADADRDGVVTPTEAVFLANSGLPRPALAQVWGICADSRGLSRQGFYRAMRCVALGQKNMDMNNHLMPNHFSVVGLPVLQNVPQPPPLPQAAPPAAMPLPTPAPAVPTPVPVPTATLPQAAKPAAPAPAAPASGSEWVISTEERLRFDMTFTRADTDRDGFITGDQARELFTRSQLPLSDLRKVWTLSDQDGDQKLNKEEFMVAMFLITVRMKGHELPDALPASLRASAAGQAPAAAPVAPLSLPSVPTAAPASPAPSPTPSPAPSPSAPAPAPLTSSGSSGALLTASGSSGALLAAAAKIPPEELAQYGALFEQVDADRDGFISGDQAKPILSMSNLPVPDLRQIWALADATGDYRLDKAEFVIAMYLINRRLRTGEPIPDRLPASLMPTAVAYDLEAKAPAPAASAAAAPAAQAPVSAPLSGSGSGLESKLAAPPSNAKANARNASRAAALERLTGVGADRERTGSLSNLQAPASPVSAYSTPPTTPTPAPAPAVASPHLVQVQRTSSGYGSPAAPSPSAYFGAQDDFAREERVRGEIDAKQAKVEAMRAQVAQGEQTKEMGVKRLEELSHKSTELDRILADMQQQLADQETAKSDILREYQDEYDKMQLNLKKLDSLKSTLLSNEKVKETTLKKLEETAAQGGKLEAEATGYEKKVEALTKDVRELQLKLDLEGTKKESAASKVDFLRSKVADLEEQRRKLDAQLQERNKSFQSEDASVQTLSSQITSATLLLEQQLAASKKISEDLNALKQKRTDMRNQLQDLQTQQTTESERTAKLLDEMAKVREEVNRLKPQVKEASKRLQATQEQQRALKTELADAKGDLTRAKDEFVAVQKSPRGDPKPLPAVPPKSTRQAVEALPKPAAPPADAPKPVERPAVAPATATPPAKEASPAKAAEKKPEEAKPTTDAKAKAAELVTEKRQSEDGKKDKKERSSRRSDRHGSHRPHKDKKTKESVDSGTLGSPSNPFEAAKDAFANPFNFGSSAADDPFAAAADSDPFDFDVAEADPLSFAGVKGVNLSTLEPRESFAVDTKNPFGGADDFGSSRFSFGGASKGDDPFA